MTDLRLPDGNLPTANNIDRWAAKELAEWKKRVSRALAETMSRAGVGEQDGAYTGSFSAMLEEEGKPPRLVYSLFVMGRCVNAIPIDMQDLESIAMKHIIEPAAVAAGLEATGARENVRPKLWAPGGLT